jgi:hypothetical protein
MATEQELAQALNPAFGIYPKAFRGNYGNPQDAANLPVDVMRGRTAGLLGMFGDVVNQPSAFTPVRAVQLAMQGVMGQDKYPDTEQFLKTLPLKPTSRAGEVAGQVASFVPLNPAPAVRAGVAGAQLAGRGAMSVGRAGERMAERVVPQIMERGGLPAELLQGMANRTISPLDVYHGTPHTLPPTERNPLGEFDASKIGTGEGAQVYGRGIYTAENPAVATEYAKANRGRGAAADNLLSNLSPGIQVDAMRALNMKDGFIRQAMLDDLMASNPKDAKILQSINEQKAGSLYKADLPDAMIAKMLDYDKPLSKQPEIMKALTPEAMGLKLRVSPQSGYMGYVSPDGVPIGLQVKGATPENFRKRWLERLAEFGDAEGGAGRVIGYLGGTSETSAAQVSEALRQAGIPGIKYLDELSRAKGEGTRNFVTFPGEEKNLTILERNAEKSAK